MNLTHVPDEDLEQLVRIHVQLSPENLVADGELSLIAARARKAALDKQLVALAKMLQLSQDDLDDASVFSEHARRSEAMRRGQHRVHRPLPGAANNPFVRPL